MAVELIVVHEALQDLQQAYDWFEVCRVGLGEDFLTYVDACVQNICRMPELYPKVHEDYRRALVRRFPYAVFYEFTSGQVIIYSIFHTSQNPKKWRLRLV